MSYKVLIPVTVIPELVEYHMKEIADLSRVIFVNNMGHPRVGNLMKQALARGAEVYNCPWNLGCAGSWNLGLRRMEEDGDDFCLILSPSAMFDVPFQKIIDHIADAETKTPGGQHLFDRGSAKHCFAMTRLGLSVGGLFDENYYPVFGEDADYCYRASKNGLGQICVQHCSLGFMHSRSISAAVKTSASLMNLHQCNAPRWTNYYRRKWGGDHCQEKYSLPFNDQSKGINDWSVNEVFNNTLIGNPAWRVPDWRACRARA